MKPAFKILTLIVIMAIACSVQGFSQNVNKQQKVEAMLTAKKWTCLDVNRGKLEKIDFRFEIGNELSLRIDKKYSFKNNDFNYKSGNWKLDGKTVYFFFQSLEEEGRIETARYKILKVTPTILRLKKLDKPTGKLEFK